MDDELKVYLDEEKRKLDAELEAVLSTELGRRFMYRLIMDVCAMDSSTFSNDDRLTAYAQGKRDIGVQLKNSVIAYSKDVYLTMERENL